MKTWEVYKNELEQPKQIYLRKSDEINYCFDVHRGLLPCEWQDAIWTTIKIDDEWELARQPVDFMTAINSGKYIKPSGLSFNFMSVSYWLNTYVLSLGKINGKWLIE